MGNVTKQIESQERLKMQEVKAPVNFATEIHRKGCERRKKYLIYDFLFLTMKWH